MDLRDAAAAILAEFGDASTEARLALHTDQCLDITSGGLRTAPDVEPALYASRELAVAAFHRETLSILRAKAPAAIALLDGPHLDKWNITVMDRAGTHRVAEPRWSVTARIGIVARPAAAAPIIEVHHSGPHGYSFTILDGEGAD